MKAVSTEAFNIDSNTSKNSPHLIVLLIDFDIVCMSPVK